ncbi:hypothetical protein [Streptomyces sp. CB01580]|uniref:hypothetical protein n=1 Tax=Streptomyces sp. CB01580 TaxID=1703933 RepID=UPI001161275E|nr:hypothetical protein [Streptomyces sp. CB01580]
MTDKNANTKPMSAPAGRQPEDQLSIPALRERVLDLIALLILIALAALVFVVAGPAAFTAVTSVGVGLFATWRTRPPRR